VASAKQPLVTTNVSGLRFENVTVGGRPIDALAAQLPR
jgi:hypothetical protein